MDSKEESVVNHDHVEIVGRSDTPKGSDLPFWKQKELRKLYGMLMFLFFGSTTLGYDGSLLNALQTMDSWQNCKLSKQVHSPANS